MAGDCQRQRELRGRRGNADKPRPMPQRQLSSPMRRHAAISVQDVDWVPCRLKHRREVQDSERVIRDVELARVDE